MARHLAGRVGDVHHRGVLEVLESDGLPIDFLCGSSMGGAVALAFARFGSARAATENVLRVVADFARARGMQWLPRASLISASRMMTLTSRWYQGDSQEESRVPKPKPRPSRR